ncbi:hypothetical protein T484DRAFT_1830474 [Baffinella frigidus]|nr:hypothetical protein T484DRAFT_1830474 [Cryptophyta sp. CCMP2293]
MVSLLHHRIRFTEQVDRALGDPDALRDGTHEAVAEEIRERRAVCIKKFRNKLPEATRKQQASMVTLFKEQLDVLADLAASQTPAVLWAGECRFYRVQNETAVVCRCGDLETPVGENFPGNDMLVVTSLTREFHRTYLKASCSAGQLLWVHGPAGTSKTETSLDTARMLGVGCNVIRCTGGLTPEAVAAVAQSDADPLDPVIFDEFQCLPPDTQEALVAAAGAQRFVVCSGDPNAPDATPMPATLAGRTVVSQAMTPPSLEPIAAMMLSTQGFEKCDALGIKTVAFFKACEDTCSKEPNYDIGLRTYKSATDVAGDAARAAG